jgi:hypothetical protein
MTFALFILYLVLSYVHPGEIVPALMPYRITYWVGMAGLAAAIASLVARRDALIANLQLWVLLVFAAILGVSLMVAERWFGAPVAALQRFGPSLTIFVLAMCGLTTLARLRMAAGCVIMSTLLLTLQGAAAYHAGFNTQLFLLDPSARTSDGVAVNAADDGSGADVEADVNEIAEAVDDLVEDDDEASGLPRIRGLGSMHDPNDLAMGMIVAIGLIAGAWRARPELRDALLVAAAGALIYGIYLTRSRGGAVALVVVLWRFTAARLGRVPAVLLLIFLATGVLAVDFGGRSIATGDESTSGRIVAWTEGLEMLKVQPILGVGYGQFVDHHTLTAHNSLVLCFAETGLVGCFFWVGLLVVTAIELRGLRQLSGDEPFDRAARHWAEGLQLALIGFLTAAFFLSRTFVPILYLLIGMSAALAAMARHEGRSIPLPALPQLGMLVLACELAGIAVVYTIVKLNVRS